MLQRGDGVPHFEVRTVEGRTVSYSTIWQRSNLILIRMPASDGGQATTYVSDIAVRMPEFASHDTACVITRDSVEGLPSPGVVVADRWGEIVHVAGGSGSSALPDPDELVEWVEYVQSRCPECEGEAK